MNKNYLLAAACIALALALVGFCASSFGAALANGCIGKAVWYLPYVAVVEAIGLVTRA